MAQRIFPRVYRWYFECRYAWASDPWGYERRAYEKRKYRRTIGALESRGFSRALEVGCSIGVFTELLAQRCDEVVAIDASALAVRRARERLAANNRVSVQRRTLPEQMPEGRFDLIVCSEVLYYWNEKLLLRALRAMEDALLPGGVLLAVHGRFESHTCPLTGDEVHDKLRAQSELDLSFSLCEPRFRLDRFEKKLPAPPIPRQSSRPHQNSVRNPKLSQIPGPRDSREVLPERSRPRG